MISLFNILSKGGLEMNIGMGEVILLLVLALLLVGGKRLPEIGRATGSALKEFKKGLATGETDKESSGTRDRDEE